MLVLRQGDQIPPHAHSGVVLGFFLLDGEIAIRHFDQVSLESDFTVVTKTIDKHMSPGGYTTNSEYKDNIHWLAGVDKQSFLFRFTVTDIPERRFTLIDNSRLYVAVNNSFPIGGQLKVGFISDLEAKKIDFF